MKKISILGVTGSIGTQTLDVIRKSNGELRLIGVTANISVEKVIQNNRRIRTLLRSHDGFEKCL